MEETTIAMQTLPFSSRARWSRAVSHRTTPIESYSGLHGTRCDLHVARSVEDVTATVASATVKGRRVTPRAGGLSFDAQAMGSDLVISLARLNGIVVDVSAREVTAEAGARWRDVVAACLPHGLVPPVVVTSGEATVGGTLSANCHSRFSPTLGKEGHSVVRLEVVTAAGGTVRCSPSEHAELFYGVIGGFGLLGVVVRATYRLVFVGTPVRVETHVERHRDLLHLAEQIRPTPDDIAAHRTVYGLFALDGDRTRLMVSTSRLVSDVPLAPMLPHRPANVMRMPLEWLVHWVAPFGQAFWNFAYDHYVRESRPYVDDFEGYTFMMDGHTRARRAAHRFGLAFRTAQTTFVLPDGDPASGASGPLTAFLDEALPRLRRETQGVALADALWLPKDDLFAFSSTPDGGGYAVTFTFEAPDASTMQQLATTLQALTERCIELGGRAHLVKCVYATPSQAARMYAPAVTTMRARKQQWDPMGTFGNDLIDRLFPELAQR